MRGRRPAILDRDDIADIDAALIDGGQSLRSIARRFDISEPNLRRYRNSDYYAARRERAAAALAGASGLGKSASDKDRRPTQSDALATPATLEGRLQLLTEEKSRRTQSELEKMSAAFVRGLWRIEGIFERFSDKIEDGEPLTSQEVLIWKAATSEFRQYLRTVGELRGDIEPPQTPLETPELHAFADAVFAALEDHPKARAAVVAALERAAE